MQNGIASIQDPILLGDGRPEDYTTSTSINPRKLGKREPSATEGKLILRLNELMHQTRAKALALIDGSDVVWYGYRDDYLKYEHFVSMSVAKSILSVATGVAICQNKLTLDTKAMAFVSELKDKDLGQAQVKHLLTMTSGTWEGNPDSTIFSNEQRLYLMSGAMNHMDVLTTDKVSSGVQKFFSPKRKPGEFFAYRSTDPLVLGIMLERATGIPYGKFIEKEILLPAGIENTAVSGRDTSGFPRADGVLRMTLMDWIRVAIWIKEQRDSETCLGRYLKEATRKQVPTHVGSHYPQRLHGYGYLFGVENEFVPDTYWAIGFAGQEIAWSTRSQKMVMSFANSDEHVVELEKIYAEWLNDR
jgi:CubicO group peptidase (beta-lactamase class C family)